MLATIQKPVIDVSVFEIDPEKPLFQLTIAQFRALSAPTSVPATESVDPDEALTVQRVADLLSCSKVQVYKLIRLYALPTVRVGESPRVRRADLRRWLDGQQLPPVQAA